ncbi:hypothetical protein ANCDUO_17769 [Ancylostoma duodenale]|uniref:DnaK family protein n=1 Tax=Ancylostoma duodenale TaxID=51022 RepID=A0A0C2G4Z7_9BILA|nr:hypothetical protein ANCDUO_17769 [Ancylostoma duodenale]
MRIHVTREEFNKLIDDLMKRVASPVDQALKIAELTLDQVDQVVLMGAGTRVPRVQEELQKFIGGLVLAPPTEYSTTLIAIQLCFSKELGRFLNTDEAIAMGALFQAAHLSKGFKVKPFGVEELVIFPVQVNFVSKQKQENGEVIEKPITRQVFQLKSKYPTTKKTITFTSYTDDFSFDLSYSGLKHFNEQQIKEFDSLVSHLNKVSISGVAKALEEKYKPEQTEFVGVKVAFQMDLSGILRIEKAEALALVLAGRDGGGANGLLSSITKTITGFFSSKTEEGEPTESDDKKEEDAVETKNGTSTDATKEKSTIPEVSKVTLKIKQMYTTAHLMSKQDVAGAKKILEQFEKRERHARERAAAENELEGYAFEVSQLLEEEEYVKHSTEEERNKLIELVKSIRNWLEDETSPDTKTSEFTKRHVALQTLLRPIKKRVEEVKTLGPALNNLESMLNSSRIMVKMGGDDEKSLFNKV